MNGAVLSAGVVVLVVAPLAPGLVELRRRRDGKPLPIDLRRPRDPRHQGRELRAELEPFLERRADDPASVWDVVARRGRPLVARHDLLLPAGDRAAAVIVAAAGIEVGPGARLGDVLVVGDAVLGCEVRLRALTGRGVVRLADRCRVDGFVDADGGITAGRGGDLGGSAATDGELELGYGTAFSRLWGMPVTAADDGLREADPHSPHTIEDVVVWGRGRLSLPRGYHLQSDLVAHSDVHIGEGAVLEATVKAHGSIHLGAGVRVTGNLIARRDVVVGRDCAIDGNIFAEGSITLEAGAQVGRLHHHKTVYAAGRMLLAPGAVVFGAVVAERRGVVR